MSEGHFRRDWDNHEAKKEFEQGENDQYRGSIDDARAQRYDERAAEDQREGGIIHRAEADADEFAAGRDRREEQRDDNNANKDFQEGEK